MPLAKFLSAAVGVLCCAAGPVAAQPHSGGPPGGPPFGIVRPVPRPYPLFPPPPPPAPPPVEAPMPQPDAPMRVMTDTPEYCMYLASIVERAEASRLAMPPDVHVLAVTGRRMCERGLLIGGLQRLRLALELLRSGP